MRRIHPARPALVLVTIAAVAVGACGGASRSSPTPAPDPRAAVVASLHDTAALHAAHIVLRLELRDTSSNQTYTVTAEGNVDIAGRELDITAKLEQPGMPSATSAQLIIADGRAFSRSVGGQWSVALSDDFMRGVPTTAKVAEEIVTAVQDPTTVVHSEGLEACGDTTCDRVRVEVTPAVAWATLMGIIRGNRLDTSGMPADFPGIAIDVWVEQGTNHLRQGTNSTVSGRQTISVTIALSAHDAPISIVAPPTMAPPVPATPR